jgi:hypothetical protein
MNGFDPDWVEAERVCVIPNSVKEKYFSEAEDVRPWPWYIYGRTFFEGVGAEFREIEDRLQMLLGEVVYEVEEFIPCSIRRLYSVGGRAVREFEGVPEFQEVATHHDEPDYLGGGAVYSRNSWQVLATMSGNRRKFCKLIHFCSSSEK